MPTLPFTRPGDLHRIIAEVETKQLATTQLERGILRNLAYKSELAEKAQLSAELSRLRPADLAKINSAVSRVERQKDLQSARVQLIKLRLNAAEQRRDIAAVRRYISGR
jgi:hypothetical protein